MSERLPELGLGRVLRATCRPEEGQVKRLLFAAVLLVGCQAHVKVESKPTQGDLYTDSTSHATKICDASQSPMPCTDTDPSKWKILARESPKGQILGNSGKDWDPSRDPDTINFFSKLEGERQELMFALMSRPLTDKEMKRVKESGYMLMVPWGWGCLPGMTCTIPSDAFSQYQEALIAQYKIKEAERVINGYAAK